MSKWLKKGDRVLVIAGNDKGSVGAVLHKTKERVVIEGVNKRKKHVKRSQQMSSAQIIEKEMPIHISNVKVCDENDRPLKLKVKFTDNNGKDLVYLDQSGKEVVYRTIKKKSN